MSYMQTADINEQKIVQKFWSCLWKSLNDKDFFEGDFYTEFEIEEYSLEVRGCCYAHVANTPATHDTPEWHDVSKRIELYSVTIYTESDILDFNINLLTNDKK